MPSPSDAFRLPKMQSTSHVRSLRKLAVHHERDALAQLLHERLALRAISFHAPQPRDSSRLSMWLMLRRIDSILRFLIRVQRVATSTPSRAQGCG